MKHWRVSRQNSLLHVHANRWGYVAYLATDGHWYCRECKTQAPKEIEDVALLARCAPTNWLGLGPPNTSMQISPP